MGCCVSIQELDRDRIHSAVVLREKGENSRYHGTTERGRYQIFGEAELILTEDGLFSQVTGRVCSKSRSFIHIPMFAITNVHKEDWFNGLYRIDRPHLVVTYIVPGKGEYQAGWQMTRSGYEQWYNTIQKLLEKKRVSV